MARLLLVSIFGCCQPGRLGGGASAGGGKAAAATGGGGGSTASSRSEGDDAMKAPGFAAAIIDPRACAGDLSKAPTNLLEASSRRVLQHSKSSSGAPLDGAAIARYFLDAYFRAIEEKNAAFASDPRIEALLGEEVRLTVAQDKAVYSGRAAVIQRLNKGVERILGMMSKAGKGGEAVVTVEDAVPAGEDKWAIIYAMKVASFKLKFVDEYTIVQGRITSLDRRKK
mmetsp:Transcript_8326/g.27273  ORF Transcript_8326/g.27273 Transcript_8326/m.27273 type:complete len:226 (-) Transcript_8326:79-756(-)